MTTFSIVTRLETFSVDAEGNIGRPAINMSPSGKWKALALVPANYGGRDRPFVVPFAQWPEFLASNPRWQYANGKPRYTIRDLDHGTMREWGGAVLAVYTE